ncbi:hypothetical protein G5714_018278 [Onychostoma macrolepis]|uniref:Uncharacterized protein n=1 Tax=Onychostoma macrolepis TaxID=369639 RepID=A0A7J6C2Q1_9TELE|nr:hypothetical protein G5714_018278 [Onychostoma macrolepis]
MEIEREEREREDRDAVVQVDAGPTAVARARMNDKWWCTCSNSQVMPTEVESYCCHEWELIMPQQQNLSIDEEANAASVCITSNDVFPINEEVRHSCSSLPNVHLVHHSSIKPWHLYDGVHLNQDGVGIFAKAIKDVALGRFPTTGYKGAKRNVRMRPFEPSGPSSRSRPPQDLHRQPMTSGWSHRQQERQLYTEGPSQQKPSYAQVLSQQTPSAAAAQELSISDVGTEIYNY